MGSGFVDLRSNLHAFYMSFRLALCLLALCVSLDYALPETSTTTATFIIYILNFTFSVVVLTV